MTAGATPCSPCLSPRVRPQTLAQQVQECMRGYSYSFCAAKAMECAGAARERGIVQRLRIDSGLIRSQGLADTPKLQG